MKDPLTTLCVILLFVSAMTAMWGALFTIWALLLMQWEAIFWCGLVTIVSGVIVRLLLEVKITVKN
jgi:hypothetical protein